MSIAETTPDALRLVDGDLELEDALPTVVTNNRQVRDIVADGWRIQVVRDAHRKVNRYALLGRTTGSLAAVSPERRSPVRRPRSVRVWPPMPELSAQPDTAR